MLICSFLMLLLQNSADLLHHKLQSRNLKHINVNVSYNPITSSDNSLNDDGHIVCGRERRLMSWVLNVHSKMGGG
jgi:hypothetical protein